MCGRFTLRVNTAQVAETFRSAQRDLGLPPSYNIAPTQSVLIVRRDQSVGERELAQARWGLFPHWVDDPDDFNLNLINARSETAPDKPAFRDAFRSRRCLIPADGFYEWVPTNGSKQPYMIHRTDDGLFAFPGLWEHWEGNGGESLESCTILTCEPDDVTGELHNRMPVVLPPDRYDDWLNPAAQGEPLQKLLRPYDENEADMEAYPVSKQVNSPANNAPDLVDRVEAS